MVFDCMTGLFCFVTGVTKRSPASAAAVLGKFYAIRIVEGVELKDFVLFTFRFRVVLASDRQQRKLLEICHFRRRVRRKSSQPGRQQCMGGSRGPI